jgi:hypothetical protein
MVSESPDGFVVLSYPGVQDGVINCVCIATAAQLAIAIDHRLQQNLLNERSQQLAVLQERQRLARELHDLGNPVDIQHHVDPRSLFRRHGSAIRRRANAGWIARSS